jgi:hypothetical protein
MISRRKLLDLTTRGMVLAIAAPKFGTASEMPFAVRNEAIELAVSFSSGKMISRSFRNRITEEVFEVPLDDVALEFEGGEVFLSSLAEAELVTHSDNDLQIEFRWNNVAARVQYHLPAGKRYLRKQVSLQSTDRPRRLIRADLENWMRVRRNWTSMTADKLKFGSHPIYSDTVFGGVEFVSAFNEYGGDGFVLRSRPGGIHIGSYWLPLNSTVLGVSPHGSIREAFVEYLEDVRLPPAKLVACYNSWWTLPHVVTQQDNLNLIGTLKEKLYDQHGVFFDIVTTDEGWSNPRSIWEIDRTQLPNGLDDIRRIVEGAGGLLGLWMSPSEVYPESCDYEWLEKKGYVVLRREKSGKQQAFALSLADPKYRTAVTEQLSKLIRDNNLGHVKYDGFVAEEQVSHHDLLPAEDSVEPLARYSLELLEVSKKANPTLVTEPTNMNSLVNYISPWILKYSNSVWGNAGGDCPLGMNPAPDYRESHTNAREYYIFSSLHEVWLPQNALQYFDIVQCDHATGFPNHAAMAFGRGRFFVPTYINPRFMTDDDWRIYAGLLKWARTNQDILRNTEIIPSRVELGEPYVYAHWLGRRGILAVRNPSNATRAFDLDMRAAHAPKDLSDVVCYTQYPYRKGIARHVTTNSVISLKLAPWELLILEIVSEPELREPVAIGARWYSDHGGTLLVADREFDAVQWLEPRGTTGHVRVSPRPALELRGHIIGQSARQLPRSEWLPGSSGPVPGTGFELECEVSIPTNASGRLLLLIEYPGREYWPSLCNATVNGVPVSLAGSSSDGHIGYWLKEEPWKKEAGQFESQWKWYDCPVPAGSSRVKFSGAAGFEQPRIGVWLWSEEGVKMLAHRLPSASPTPAMPEYQANFERDGICIRPSARIV